MILPVEVSDNTRQLRSDVFSDVNFFQYFVCKRSLFESCNLHSGKVIYGRKNVHVRFQCEEKENKTRIRKKVSIYIPKVADFFYDGKCKL